MTAPQYAVREAWERFKGAARATHEPLAEALALAAIEKWAEHEAGAQGSPVRGMREALAASIAGAAMVDRAVEKLAAQGHYTHEERDFLLDLNAESAVRDLRLLLKTSAAFDGITSFVQRHPTSIGAGVGALVGGGIGALKDEENPARGAVLYGVPGAVIGGLAGHGAGQWHDVRQRAAQEQARKVVDDAAAAAEAAQATHDWNYKLHQGREWAKVQDAGYADSVQQLAKTDPEYAPVAASLGGQVVKPQDHPRLIQDARARMDAEAATGAQAAAQAAHAANAARMQTQIDNGKRLFNNLLQASASFASGGGDPDEAFHAKRVYDALKANERQIIEHAAKNPGKLHRSVIDAAGVGPGAKILSDIHNHAKRRFDHGN